MIQLLEYGPDTNGIEGVRYNRSEIKWHGDKLIYESLEQVHKWRKSNS